MIVQYCIFSQNGVARCAGSGAAVLGSPGAEHRVHSNGVLFVLSDTAHGKTTGELSIVIHHRYITSILITHLRPAQLATLGPKVHCSLGKALARARRGAET